MSQLKVVTMIFINYRKKSGSLKTSYKRDYINAGIDTDFELGGPTIKGAAVIG